MAVGSNRFVDNSYDESLRPADMFTAGYLKHLDFCMDVGLVARAREVTEILSKYDLRHLAEFASIVDRARDWLPVAELFEASHGAGSLLNVSHPRYLRVAAKARARTVLRSESA
jgi:hypothetical protein